MDRLTREQRSKNMSRIGPKDTAPELGVRQILRDIGFHYRLHAKDLPGRPDIVNRKRRIAVFVHGCFWHAHSCKRGKRPSSNKEFWYAKIAGNQKRDRANIAALRRNGWRVAVIWECQLKEPRRVRARLAQLIARASPTPYRTSSDRRDAQRHDARCKA